jgi:hypothetical protein
MRVSRGFLPLAPTAHSGHITVVMTETLLAWAFLIGFYLVPLAHVAVSPRGGPWRAPPGSRCPFSPRVGWLVIVSILGALGWLLYLRSTRERGRLSAS